MSPAAPSRRRPAVAAVAALAVAAVAAFWVLDPQALAAGRPALRRYIDFAVYRAGGAAWVDGAAVYDTLFDAHGYLLPFTYPPAAAALFAPLALVPVRPAGAVFALVNLAVLGWLLAVFFADARPSAGRRPAWPVALCALPVCAFAEPVYSTLDYGQVNLVLAALVVADARSPRARGVLTGLAAAVKLTPAVFVLFFLVRRDFAAAGRAVATGAAVTLAAAVPRPGVWADYFFDALGSPERIGGLAFATNQSLTGALVRLTGQRPGLLWVGLVVLVVAAAALGAWRVGSAAPAGQLVTVATVALVCSPVAWSHHWVWLLPAVVVTAGSGTRAGRAWALAAGAAVAARPHLLMPHGTDAELDWAAWQHLVGDAYLWLALLLIVLALACPRALRAPGRTAPARSVQR